MGGASELILAQPSIILQGASKWLLHSKRKREFSDTNFEIRKPYQGFPVSKLVSENSLFCLDKEHLKHAWYIMKMISL